MPFALEQLLSTSPSAPMVARASQVSDPTQVINGPVRHLIERNLPLQPLAPLPFHDSAGGVSLTQALRRKMAGPLFAFDLSADH